MLLSAQGTAEAASLLPRIPAISTGIFGYPIAAAARIAVTTVRSTPTQVSNVRFVVCDQETWNVYDDLLKS